MNRRTTPTPDSWSVGTGAAEAPPPAKLGRLLQADIRLRRERVRPADVSWMLHQLATTEDAGLPLMRSLAMLAGMRKGTVLGKRLDAVLQSLSEGSGFAAALREYEDEFGKLVCALIEAGEQSGTLRTSLARAAEIIDARRRLIRKVRSAMSYPAIVVTVTTALVAVLMTFVVPRFASIYASLHAPLPALTQVVIDASHYVPAVALALAALTLTGIAITRRSRQDAALARRIEAIKFRIPKLGSLAEKSVHARAAATLGSMLAAGIHTLEALTYAADVCGSVTHRQALLDTRALVQDGALLSEALEASGRFPLMLVQLAAVGEESGSLPDLMQKYADIAEKEVSDSAEDITRMIEPLMMLVIGTVVGTILLALYQPMLDLNNQIG